MNLSPAQSSHLENSLRREVSGEVRFDEHTRRLYATDASMYQILPLGVVVPRDKHDVAAVVRQALRAGVPVIARGSGTSLSGQSIGPGIIVDFSKFMDQILEIDVENRTARVQPGVVLDAFNAQLDAYGLQFGPDVATASRANLGGMIGNNSAGARSIRNGKTVDHVITLEVVLGDGTIAELGPVTDAERRKRAAREGIEGTIYGGLPEILTPIRDEIIARYPPLIRRVSGYNLDQFVDVCRERMPVTDSVRQLRDVESERFAGADFNPARLVVGAEGTLGLVTEAVVHLIPKPAHRGILVLEFDSLPAAIRAVGPILESRPTAIELFDKMILELAAESLEYRNYLDFVVGKPESLLIAEFGEEEFSQVEHNVRGLIERLNGHAGLTQVTPALEPELGEHIWACRKAALPLLMGIPGNRKPIAFVEDTAINPPRLPEFVDRFRGIVERAGTTGAFYGHASVGCLHIRPLIDTRSKEDLVRMEQMLIDVADLVREFDGAMSGEHGDGLARSALNERLYGPTVYSAFQEVKRLFDPHGIFNPGKVVNGPPPTENLRHPPEQETLKLETAFDFSKQGGFATSAELCNGSGLCRKLRGGTMCPSFMALRDEEHSTRGRANALRLVLDGEAPRDSMYGQRMYETFETCLGCKACKAECPSNVDVAKLKSEWLHQFYEHRGRPLGARLLADPARLNAWGAAFAPLSNAAARFPGASWVQSTLMGMDRRRPAPRFVRDHFRRWFRRRQPKPAEKSRGPVVLLDDCLTSYLDPGVNRAAVLVLEAAGYEVQLAGIHCCGRAAISGGMLDMARRFAHDTVERLATWARKGVPIVGCEPSCLLTLTDDYRDLIDGEPTRQVADACRMVDAFLVEAGVNLAPATPAGTVALHGHCHQKALVGTGDTVQMLSQFAGAEASVIPSGCCGMAGAFGYQQYELSMQIGELVLLPAVRSRGEATVAAAGYSCREQILHGTGYRAPHPIELVAAALT